MMVYLLYTDTFGYELEMFVNQQAAHEAAVLLAERRAYIDETVEVRSVSAGDLRHALKSYTTTTFSWKGKAS